jgi:hypothetical protein
MTYDELSRLFDPFIMAPSPESYDTLIIVPAYKQLNMAFKKLSISYKG